MKKKLRAAFINYSLLAGGAERNVINLAGYFNKQGVHADILLFKNINEYKYEYKNRFKDLTIIPLLKTEGKIPFFLRPFFAIKLLFQLHALMKKNRYDLLVAAEEYDPFFITILFSRIFQIKSLLLVGNNVFEEIKLNGILLKIMYRVMFFASFRLSDHIICVSEGLRSDLMANFLIPGGKITTIHNGIDEGVIQKLKNHVLTNKEKKTYIDKKIVISMGRLVYKKGFEHLIKAFVTVKKHVPNAMLIIIGKGLLNERLLESIRNLKLEKDVVMLGFEKKNPYRLLGKADLFAFSSLYEGFGNVLIEAMHCGTPVISMDCPYGPKEIIEDNKWGILTSAINPNDTKEMQNRKEQLFANEIIRLLKNKTLLNKYKKLSLRRAKSFTLDIMGKKYLKVIHDMME